MKRSKTLLETITATAAASYHDKPITKANYSNWCDHWIKTGKQWAEELKAEGLTITAEAVAKHVEWEEKNKIELK